jgi:hypothetical protein
MTNPTGLAGRPLTTTEAALIDLQRQEQAIAERRRLLTNDPAIPSIPADHSGQGPWDAETLAELTRPVRIEINFDGGPLKVREQIDALAAVLADLRAETYKHDRGIARQMLQLRHIAKAGADTLVYMNGKTPSGKRRRAAR